MKKMTKTKLRLGSETLRQLATVGLREVVGGARPANTVIMDGCDGPPQTNSNGGGCGGGSNPPPSDDGLLGRA